MIELSTLLTFVPAALVIIISPGPDTLYVLTQSIKSGQGAGLSAGLGTASGVLVHTTAAVFGLAALLETSGLLYTIIKYLGVLYLFFFGVQMLRNDDEFNMDVDALDDHNDSVMESYKKAVVVDISNPKVAVFVLAFFPQFIPSQANVTLQMILLGVLYAILRLSYLSGVTLFTAHAQRKLLESPLTRRAVRYANGSVLLGFGAKLAFEKRPLP
ncbi:MAG: putative threonine efflux protein [Haloquadratum walsbyi J07HQW1]|jgi:Putative threonine efflux protein|uniref:Putative threonine efflux protein n=1 Tax=Haloquadratum walsbyi J07HQW1 TaxID=1238424 RepID=U1N5X5_9EURY|nr:MAG: putative threonine efflux protein [Haloquadratum walsbyi J07HQW1]